MTQDPQRDAMDRALKFLSFRARSEKEMADYLEKKGFEEAVRISTLDRLKELGLITDEQLAKEWVAHRRRSGQGDFRIRRDLERRGFSGEVLNSALAENREDEKERAWMIFQKRWPRLAGLAPEVRERRMFGFLQRQGFGRETIFQVLRRGSVEGIESREEGNL